MPGRHLHKEHPYPRSHSGMQHNSEELGTSRHAGLFFTPSRSGARCRNAIRRAELQDIAAAHRLVKAKPVCWMSRCVRSVRTNPAHRDCPRSEEHTSELQSLMRISYAVLFLKKK